jgi:hypothetical protein
MGDTRPQKITEAVDNIKPLYNISFHIDTCLGTILRNTLGTAVDEY